MAQYDIHFQPVPEDEVTGKQCFEFGYAAALKVDGFQSLINRWAKTLMTPRGSDPLDREAGTNFSNMIGGNVSRVTTGIRDLVGAAIEDANEQVRQQDSEGFRSDTEKLQGAELADFREVQAGFEVWVWITNVAGTRLAFRVVSV
jgi:hypothetical protein